VESSRPAILFGTTPNTTREHVPRERGTAGFRQHRGLAWLLSSAAVYNSTFQLALSGQRIGFVKLLIGHYARSNRIRQSHKYRIPSLFRADEPSAISGESETGAVARIGSGGPLRWRMKGAQ
jgi:hypothetical protein